MDGLGRQTKNFVDSRPIQQCQQRRSSQTVNVHDYHIMCSKEGTMQVQQTNYREHIRVIADVEIQ